MGSMLSMSYLSNSTEEVVESTDDEDSFHSQSSTPAECDISSNNTNSNQFKMDLKNKLETATHGLQTDAVQNIQIHRDETQITFETVRDIERDLDLYEKISLVFLLYENEDHALQNLLIEIANADNNSTISPIYKWAHSKHAPEKPWHKQLLEALCIIENYNILQRLGYEKNDLKSRFLPANPSSAIFINLVRKTLYTMCENLTKKNTMMFIKYLREDFEKKSIAWQEYDEDYLEIYILHCFSRKYIKEFDLSNITKILKKMNLEVISIWLDSAMSEAMRNKQTDSYMPLPSQKEINEIQGSEVCVKKSAIVKPISSTVKPATCSDHSLIGDQSIITDYSDDDCYRIDPKNVGICVIFNQKTFYRDTDPELQVVIPLDHELQRRNGTDFDKNRLTDTFTKLGFRIKIFEDKTHAEIESCVSEMTKEVSKNDSCFVVCVLSHGVEDCVYGSNSVPVRIKDIEDQMYKNLAGKPKILIIQSCQGKDLQAAISDGSSIVTDGITPNEQGTTSTFNITAGVNSIPPKSDFLLCSSTIPRYASVRDEKKGSWYIQELCDRILKECNKNHFADILTGVNRAVCGKRWHKEGRYVCMVPEFRSSFRKNLFLPIVGESSEGSQ